MRSTEKAWYLESVGELKSTTVRSFVVLCMHPRTAANALTDQMIFRTLTSSVSMAVTTTQEPGRRPQLCAGPQSSTVQILGAEKALFRALKTKGNTPKYGLIFHSSFIGRAKARNKGRISRYLANKASIASRIDCFMEVATSAFGEKMKEQVRLDVLPSSARATLMREFAAEAGCAWTK